MDKSILKSLAGWALTRSDQECYRKLLEALSEVIPNAPDQTEVVVEVPSEDEHVRKLPDFCDDSHPGIAQGYTPVAVRSEDCPHKFHLKTQRCIHCNRTYLEVRSRKPECF